MAADTNTTNTATTNAVDLEGKAAEAVVIGTQESLRSSLAIQEQLKNMEAAIEKDRKDGEAAAARNADMLEARLKLVEAANASQHLDELKRLQSDNRMVLLGAGAFALVGFVVLLFAAFVQWTAVSRISALSARLPQMLGAGPTALGMGDLGLLSSSADQSTAKFLGVIEKLEKRIDGIEKGAPQPLLDKAPAGAESTNGTNGVNGMNGSVAEEHEEKSAERGQAEEIALLMGKGQTLLKLDKPEEAIASFDQALAIDSGNTDILVRKGAALERLQRLDEAIACYDLAIASDKTMTMAYLYKGGVYNRMERYSEALECYEAALKTQQKGKGEAANVIIEN